MLQLAGFKHNFVTTKVADRAGQLIDQYELHRHPHEPIDIGPLLAQINLQFLDMPPTTYGFTLDTGGEIVIALNTSLDAPLMRSTALHEVGHISMWHPNQLHACQEERWVYDRLEVEATTIAAMILVPELAIENGISSFQHVQRLAQHYIVPPELVLVRHIVHLAIGC